MGRHAKTEIMLQTAIHVLRQDHPMTVRQVYYRLVSRQVIENTRAAYQAVSKLLVSARKSGEIPWEWIEDRLRRPRAVPMWGGLADYYQIVRESYRRDVWVTQPVYIEAWLEKDALSGIFEDVLCPYGVTLNVGRGYDGWDSIRNAADRYTGRPVVVIYFGDFDPSGEDMVRSLGARLADLGSHPELVKVALTRGDIDRYALPPDPAKRTDTRSAAFVAQHGDLAVELDALPPDVLRDRIMTEIESRMDLDALAKTRRREVEDLGRLAAALKGCE